MRKRCSDYAWRAGVRDYVDDRDVAIAIVPSRHHYLVVRKWKWKAILDSIVVQTLPGGQCATSWVGDEEDVIYLSSYLRRSWLDNIALWCRLVLWRSQMIISKESERSIDDEI